MRKLPRQVDNSKVEFPASSSRLRKTVDWPSAGSDASILRVHLGEPLEALSVSSLDRMKCSRPSPINL